MQPITKRICYVATTEKADPSGFKHRGTCLVTGLVLTRYLKAAKDNCFGDSADLALFFLTALDSLRALVWGTRLKSLDT
jgi:hypothetical protein